MKCDDGTIIRKSTYCNSQKDCPDGTDEILGCGKCTETYLIPSTFFTSTNTVFDTFPGFLYNFSG
jgi:hypothetical protein